VPFLQSLHELIRTCQFTKFWSEFNGSSDAAKRGYRLPPSTH
jgi:translation initiation factor 3 subunit K